MFSVFEIYGFGIESGERPAIAFLVLLYGIAMWGFFGMKFQVTGEEVLIYMPPLKYGIKHSEISGVEVLEGIPWYTGWGLRIQGRKIIFAGKHDRAVLIKKEEGFFRKVILVPEKPDEFVKQIRIGME